jgi:hypothetical protein
MFGIQDTGLARPMEARAGWVLAMTEIDSLMGTGKAIAAGLNTITVGTVTGIAIGANAATGIGIATSS